MVCHSVEIIYYDLWIFCLISVHRCLPSKSCTAPFGFPPLFLYSLPLSLTLSLIILSFCLTMSTVSQSTAVEDATLEGALSPCGCQERSEQSRSSQGYMAQCGCHEILIQRCVTVFFLSIFVDLSLTASESSPFLCSKLTLVVFDLSSF